MPNDDNNDRQAQFVELTVSPIGSFPGTDHAMRHLGSIDHVVNVQSATGTNVAYALAAMIAAMYSPIESSKAGFTKDIVKAASDLDEAAGQFSHVFRSVRSEAQSMASTLQKEYGRSTKASMAMLTATGDLFVGMGMPQRAALGLSGQIAKLSVEMGSFKNLNVDDVSNAFTSAIMGNTQAVKRLGIALDDETLKAELAKQKKEGLIFASEREAKAQAIVAVAYRQAGNAIGDYARESKKYANQLSTLNDNLGELKEKFGEAFLEPVTKIINVFDLHTKKWSTSTFGTLPVSMANFGAIEYKNRDSQKSVSYFHCKRKPKMLKQKRMRTKPISPTIFLIQKDIFLLAGHAMKFWQWERTSQHFCRSMTSFRSFF